MKKHNTRSQFDPSRETVGKIYRDLQLLPNQAPVLVGDMTNEMMKDLKVDIEEGLADCFKYSIEKKNKEPFWFMVHEKKDLQMNKSLQRVRHYFGYLPWPEDDTTVFMGKPKTREVFFCWSLPHHSEMDNILANPDLFDTLMVIQVKAWKEVNLRPFGFYQSGSEGWLPNPHHKFKKIGDFYDGNNSGNKSKSNGNGTANLQITPREGKEPAPFKKI